MWFDRKSLPAAAWILTTTASRLVIACALALCFLSHGRTAEPTLPVGPAPNPAMFSHFPDSVHALVWRNWHAVEPARIAKGLGTAVENVTAVAESMGLPPAVPIPAEQNFPS